MFKSIDISYFKPSHFNNISLILGIWYVLCFNCLVKFLKLIRKTLYFFWFVMWKIWRSTFRVFAIFKNPSGDKCSTSFLNISSCNLDTGYGLQNICLSFSFYSKCTGYFFRVPSVSSENS